MLLILDNCEHLSRAIASLAETIIRSCPNISILATSREPLAIAGESIYRMPSLTFPEHTDNITADEALNYSAVQLFALRAGAAVQWLCGGERQRAGCRRDLQEAGRDRTCDRAGGAEAEDDQAKGTGESSRRSISHPDRWKPDRSSKTANSESGHRLEL